MDKKQSDPKWNREQLSAILERYLPADILPQVKEALQELYADGGQADLWRFRDRVTGMYNAQGILQILESWKAPCLETGEQILLLCIDIEGLESIKQIYGNFEGDAVTQVLGEILETDIPANATCGHLEGSEFVVLLRTAKGDKKAAEDFMANVHEQIENYNRLSAKDYSIHIDHLLSVVVPSANIDMEEALGKALSMKRLQSESKKGILGGPQKQHIDPEEHRLVKEVLDQNLFRYAFQPIVDAKTGDIYAYEALMRTEGNISLSPLAILKYAMLDDRLYDIERATFFNVLRHLSARNSLGDRKIFINSISNCPLNSKDYKKLRTDYEALFPNMVVEVTEQTEMDDERLELLLKRSKKDGFGLAVDDYGTGYSNTSSLLRYLPNCVKIDHLLISGIQEDPKKQHFVNNIISFAHDNGFLALAEGVESSAELRAVIQMGADLVQGFYTAKPDFELLDELPEKIKHEIISDNLNLHDNIQRKVYIVDNVRELPLVQLALEQYTGIVISQPEFTLIGNPDYLASMSIKVKDGCTCRLTIRDLYMEGPEDMPCIDIGNNAHLTLVLEGSSVLTKTGIRVPDGSSLHLEGAGNLAIRTKGIYCYGIGNDFNSGVGSITHAASGRLEITTDGNYCIGIGGGIYRQGSGIRIMGGALQLTVAGVEAIGIGCLEGAMPIELQECGISIDFRVNSGCAIGCWNSDQNICIKHLDLNILGSGSHLCGIGSTKVTGGRITLDQGYMLIQMTGQKVRLLGNEGGHLQLEISKSHLVLNSEGSNVLGIGCFDNSAVIKAVEVSLEIRLMAAENIPIGALEENTDFTGGQQTLRINT